jgi:hypothetical protein
MTKKRKIIYGSILVTSVAIFVLYISMFFFTVEVNELKTPVNEIVIFKYPTSAYRLYVYSEYGVDDFFLSTPKKYIQCSYSPDSIYVTTDGESNSFWRIFKPLETLVMKHRGIKPIILTNDEFERLKQIRENNKIKTTLELKADSVKPTESVSKKRGESDD